LKSGSESDFGRFLMLRSEYLRMIIGGNVPCLYIFNIVKVYCGIIGDTRTIHAKK